MSQLARMAFTSTSAMAITEIRTITGTITTSHTTVTGVIIIVRTAGIIMARIIIQATGIITKSAVTRRTGNTVGM